MQTTNKRTYRRLTANSSQEQLSDMVCRMMSYVKQNSIPAKIRMDKRRVRILYRALVAGIVKSVRISKDGEAEYFFNGVRKHFRGLECDTRTFKAILRRGY